MNLGDLYSTASLSGSGLGADDDFTALTRELSGDDGDDDLSGLGAEELGIIRAMVARGLPQNQTRAAVKSLKLSRARPLSSQATGYQLLSPTPRSQDAFGMSGSLCLLSFQGTIPAGGAATPITVILDRDSTIRELACEAASANLRVTNFTAAALPFGGLQFPMSLARFGPNSQDRKIRAMSFPANSRFVLTLSNLTGADINALVEGWGTAG